VYHSFFWLIPGLLILLYGLYAWAIEPPTEPEPAPEPSGELVSAG